MEGFLIVLFVLIAAPIYWLSNQYTGWRRQKVKKAQKKVEEESEEWYREHQKELEEIEKLEKRRIWLAKRDQIDQEENLRMQRKYLEAKVNLFKSHPSHPSRRNRPTGLVARDYRDDEANLRMQMKYFEAKENLYWSHPSRQNRR